jgi:hypothetical protein
MYLDQGQPDQAEQLFVHARQLAPSRYSRRPCRSMARLRASTHPSPWRTADLATARRPTRT